LGLVQSLTESEAKSLGASLVDRFSGMTPQSRTTGIKVLLNRPDSTLALLDAIDKGVVLLSELSLDQKQSLSVHPNRDVQRQAKELLNRGGALPNPDRQKVLAQLLSLTKQTGDAPAGKTVFKKQCAKCHMHSGEGTRIGPDLTGMAVHPKAELLTHIIDPSRDVEGNYRLYTVLTADGLVLNGLLASESKTAIELFDVEGKKKSILREDIDEMLASRKSLMPEGFEKQIGETDMVNLLEFLTQRGKFLPLDLRKVATIASDRGMFYSKDASEERLIFADWSPKTFKGVPFQLTDPKEGKVPNIILLNGPLGGLSRTMPKSISLPCNGPSRAIHLLSGVSGWGFPYSQNKTVSMIVRLHYADGQTEDHEFQNGIHFADYIRRVDVPGSEFAFALRRQQIRYLAVLPKRTESIEKIDFIKGPDRSAPVVMAVTLESLTETKDEK
ncbi:MAG: c-type cytochrome, partial [Planctomycetaceae bacterium]|nr:c-type cytochrome [Planctomycetaceae bacterium]